MCGMIMIAGRRPGLADISAIAPDIAALVAAAAAAALGQLDDSPARRQCLQDAQVVLRLVLDLDLSEGRLGHVAVADVSAAMIAAGLKYLSSARTHDIERAIADQQVIER